MAKVPLIANRYNKAWPVLCSSAQPNRPATSQSTATASNSGRPMASSSRLLPSSTAGNARAVSGALTAISRAGVAAQSAVRAMTARSCGTASRDASSSGMPSAINGSHANKADASAA